MEYIRNQRRAEYAADLLPRHPYLDFLAHIRCYIIAWRISILYGENDEHPLNEN